jgi:predicted nucleotidyltransferase
MDLNQLRSGLAAALQSHAEIDLALLFGSRARGETSATSDADVAVVSRGHDAIDTLGLSIELSDILGLEVDVVDLLTDPPLALLLAVLPDGIKVHEGRPGAYGRFLSHSLMNLETDLPTFRIMQRAFVQRVAERGLSGSR